MLHQESINFANEWLPFAYSMGFTWVLGFGTLIGSLNTVIVVLASIKVLVFISINLHVDCGLIKWIVHVPLWCLQLIWLSKLNKTFLKCLMKCIDACKISIEYLVNNSLLIYVYVCKSCAAETLLTSAVSHQWYSL